MDRWLTYRNKLCKINKVRRTALYKNFMKQHRNFHTHTADALEAVVVQMVDQCLVADIYSMHKQSLNRAVKIYKEYLDTVIA